MTPAIYTLGLIRRTAAGGRSQFEAAAKIYREIVELIGEFPEASVVIETPAAVTGRANRQFSSENRSHVTAPIYGIAVGAAMTACAACDVTPLEVASNRWPWRDMPSTRDDRYKERRVAYAARLFQRPMSDFGARTVAGNAADAALLGVWGLGRVDLAKTPRVLAIDPSMDCTGWAVVEER